MVIDYRIVIACDINGIAKAKKKKKEKIAVIIKEISQNEAQLTHRTIFFNSLATDL
jgi:hypothetical protein